jgi:hypothetical protein
MIHRPSIAANYHFPYFMFKTYGAEYDSIEPPPAVNLSNGYRWRRGAPVAFA